MKSVLKTQTDFIGELLKLMNSTIEYWNLYNNKINARVLIGQ